ncbi:DUF4314 domain-containing protein [Ligilactobacillus agilis]|nr:DUF4314 domain-containing protein [Ligilactobacillus agilis]
MLTTRQIKILKDNCPAGSVVRLLAMDDIQAPPPGTLGTVAGVDDIGNILVNWQNGSHLSLIYGEDKWEVIK